MCAACGSGMTLRSGKSNRYRYYACAGRAQKGPTKCEGCAVPMNSLDTLVLDQLADRLFQPDRLTDLLKGYLDQSQHAEHERRQRLGRLKAELTATEGAIQQLLAMVEKGLMEMDDPALAERLRQHKANRAKLNDEITLAGSASTGGTLSITPPKLDRMSKAMREVLKTGPTEFRRAYLRMFVHRVVVSRREVRISGPKAALAKAAGSDVPAPGPEVLSFVREWRPVGDSNPCWCRERARRYCRDVPYVGVVADISEPDMPRGARGLRRGTSAIVRTALAANRTASRSRERLSTKPLVN